MAGRHRILDECPAERQRRCTLNVSRDCVSLDRSQARGYRVSSHPSRLRLSPRP
jgi:hypothetical protein